MMRLAALLAVLAAPVAADMRVTQAECTGSWLRVADLLVAPLSGLMALESTDEEEN